MSKVKTTIDLKFSNYNELSFKDNKDYYIEVLLKEELISLVEVYTDLENENREYIIINYEMIYLDTIKNIT